MVFKYKAITDNGEKRDGTIDAVSKDLAIGALQRRGFVVLSIEGDENKKGLRSVIFKSVSNKEIVILSRQIATLFEAQVSALKAFSLLSASNDNPYLQKVLTQIVDDLQAGFSISGAMEKHPDVFSNFYTSMVKVAEESGKLNQTFIYLADYLERQHQLTSKTKNALIYPAFVVVVFISVMVLLLTLVIPKLSQLIIESGQEIPIYTRIVIGASNFFVNYGFILLIGVVFGGVYLWWLSGTEKGKLFLDRLKLATPAFGNLYRKLYLSRISDNLDTMLTSGIPIVRSIDLTAEVVGNKFYENIMRDTAEKVKSGFLVSDALAKYPEDIPNIFVQMTKIGEETGKLGQILKTLSNFYRREVNDAVDTLIGLIEPAMIVFLGLGVGILVASVLIPIYNISSTIS
ncbi:MAG TPA: type II secretion system F family protein [Candidatus Paceibacterota bacterium]|nr:type II secretion system F family protein [Candidatus Paceibacterota bacterium]